MIFPQEMLNDLHRCAPNAATLDLKQVVSFGCAVLSPDSTLPDFPMDSLRNIAKIFENNPSMPVHDAIYRLYPFRLFLPKDSIQGVLTLLSSLDISIPSDDAIHQQRIVGVEPSVSPSTHECVGAYTFLFALCPIWWGFRFVSSPPQQPKPFKYFYI